MHNVKTEKEFIKCKAFRRIATSILYQDLIEEYDKLFDRDAEEIIHQLVAPLENDVNILKEYVKNNVKRVNSELLDSLLEVAKEFNLYDFQNHDVYLRVKQGMEKYSFLSLIEEPNSRNKDKVNSLIAQILYHQKMYHGLHENLEISIKQPEVVAVTEEETILEEQIA